MVYGISKVRAEFVRDCDATQRVTTRQTRLIRTAMSGLSSGTGSCGGEAARFLGGGEGERCLKKVKMVAFFFFFFWGEGFVAVASGTWTSISSSVGGAEDREESESAMVADVWVDVGRGGSCGCSCGTRRGTANRARLGTHEVMLIR